MLVINNNTCLTNIRPKLIIIFSLVGIIPIILISFLTYEFSYDTILKRTQDQLLSEAYQRGNALSHVDELRIEQLNTLSVTNEVQNIIHVYQEINNGKSVDKDILQDHHTRLDLELKKFQIATGGDTGFKDITIVNKKGQVIFSSDKAYANKNISKDELFIRGLKESFRILVLKDGQRRGEVVVPVKDYSSANLETIGVIMAYTGTQLTDSVLLNREGLGNSGESYLVNSDKILATPSRFIDGVFKQKVDTLPVRECFEKGVNYSGEYIQSIKQIGRQVTVLHAKAGIAYPDYRGIPVFGTSFCLQNGYVLLVEIDKQEVLAPLVILEQDYAIAITSIIFSLLIIIIVIARQISRPIVELRNAVHEIAKGNLDVNIRIKGSNEISELARQFNNMRNNIKFVNSNLENLVKEKTIEIEKSNRKMAKIMTTLDKTGLVSFTDKDGIITYANEKFCETSQYSSQELIGKNHRIIKSEHHPPEFYKKIWETISKGNIWEGMIKNKARNGTFYWVKTIIVPFFDEKGNIVEYGSIRTNITKEIELMEKIKKTEKLSIIGEIAARISHDLRNPLAVIMNTLEIIKIKNYDKEAVLQQMGKIEKASKRMTYQIEDVLNFVRNTPLTLQSVSTYTLLKGVIEHVTIPRNIKINLPANDINILCDVRKIDALFTNLITNAIQAIDQQVGQIDIETTIQNNEVLITVKDNGPGIKDDVLQHIFEPLFTTKQTGTGLGLITCKNIVEEHHGKIDVISTIGKGTTFLINIPINTS